MNRSTPIALAGRLLQLLNDSRRYATFSSTYGAFRGVYRTFEEAIAHAPATKPIGYNQPDLAKWYVATLKDTIESHDYPMLFWLSRLLNENVKIFDFGGNVGTHFYAYSRYLDFPKGLSWTVCDVPEIVSAGEELAKCRNQNSIRFTTRPSEASGCDVFIASGSGQYLESPDIKTFLEELEDPPLHLMINRLPLYDGEPYVTLQNGGLVFYPQCVFNRTLYVGALARIGYELVDVWEDYFDRCLVPFHRNKSLNRFCGLYFRHVRWHRAECPDHRKSAANSSERSGHSVAAKDSPARSELVKD